LQHTCYWGIFPSGRAKILEEAGSKPDWETKSAIPPHLTFGQAAIGPTFAPYDEQYF